MKFRNAEAADLKKILKLYADVSRSDFSVWDEDYPGTQEIDHDFETDNIFVLIEDDRLTGAISIVPENEMDMVKCWTVNAPDACEIARVAVAPEAQGRGLALIMVNYLTQVIIQRGYKSIHLAAAVCNIPAVRTYQKAGFEKVAEEDMFGHHYYLFEKII
ncbi:MAG: GNAT family N-acetyltransferase [Oscillospiraceae bacterium]|nr:GNAT family N-acetyltransferase [Oscillospiraceae bacterium]